MLSKIWKIFVLISENVFNCDATSMFCWKKNVTVRSYNFSIPWLISKIGEMYNKNHLFNINSLGF